MTQHTWKHVTQETHIQPLLESVGLLLDGPATLNKIRLSRSLLTIATTLIDLCVRNSDTGQITEANPTPSPANPRSPSTSSKISNQSISEPFLHTSIGNDGLMINFEDLDFWLRSQGASDGSLEDAMIQQCCGRLSHMIHKVLWPT